MYNFICMNFEYINSNSRKIIPLSEAVKHITYYIMDINWKKIIKNIVLLLLKFGDFRFKGLRFN